MHGSAADMKPTWLRLYRSGVDIVLNGHDHDYERFAPQTPDGQADPRRGIREFVVGTGGRSHYPIGRPVGNSVVRNHDTYGVLALKLRPGAYEWKFIAGQAVFGRRLSGLSLTAGQPRPVELVDRRTEVPQLQRFRSDA